MNEWPWHTTTREYILQPRPCGEISIFLFKFKAWSIGRSEIDSIVFAIVNYEFHWFQIDGIIDADIGKKIIDFVFDAK